MEEFDLNKVYIMDVDLYNLLIFSNIDERGYGTGYYYY